MHFDLSTYPAPQLPLNRLAPSITDRFIRDLFTGSRIARSGGPVIREVAIIDKLASRERVQYEAARRGWQVIVIDDCWLLVSKDKKLGRLDWHLRALN